MLFAKSNALPSHVPNTKDISIYNPIPAASPPPPPTYISPRSLTPRDYGYQAFLILGAGWNLYYSSWTSSSLPIQPAAWALTRLYINMVSNAGSIWRLSPPLHTVPLQVGNVNLLMECAEEPIPWDLVLLFGHRLLAITQGGWTGLYRVMLSHAESGMSVNVVLRVVERVVDGAVVERV